MLTPKDRLSAKPHAANATMARAYSTLLFTCMCSIAKVRCICRNVQSGKTFNLESGTPL